jgi:TolA-binding protein
MKAGTRIFIYAVLVVLVIVFFRGFRRHYSAAASADNRPALNEPLETNQVGQAEAAPPAATNEQATAERPTNAAPTVAGATNTNVIAQATNKPARAGGGQAPIAASFTQRSSQSLVSLGAFVVSLILLAGLGAWDLSRFIADRAHRTVFDEDSGADTDPDYEAAEEEWGKGNYLESVNLFRAYLKRYPREQHVAIRIAEIYEKDLHNYVAAVMELEEVLQHKLPREKWGWTAIHLSNLYSGKLEKTDKALALLNRIVQEYSETGAARKARERLGLSEPAEEVAAEPAPDGTPVAPPEEPSNLPRGFKQKKR